jgi:hypothetical protein
MTSPISTQGWDKPLNEEQIAWLQEQFEIAKQRIENVWGGQPQPWKQNRRD